MKHLWPIVCGAVFACLGLVLATLAGGRAQSPPATTSPETQRVVVVNQPPLPLPVKDVAVDEATGVWHECGPAGNTGTLPGFSRDHPRARIVQVFVDASMTCQPKTYGFVIVFQEAAAHPSLKR